jgi:geranylgeranylglycerol-phosphate geranylgeranyltransferase
LDFGAYIRIIRPSGCILIAATTLIGQALALSGLPESTTAAKAILSGFLLTASSFTLNDYVDHKIDSINTPQRPIPSGRMTRLEALRYGYALGIAGVAATLSLNPTAAALGIAIYALTIFYTVKMKLYGFIGNIIVALSIASYFLFGALTVKTYIEPNIVCISCICFFYVLGGEVAQSIADAEGDRLRGVKSIPLMSGSRTAAIVASVCYGLMAVMGAYTAFLFGYEANDYSSIIVVSTILIVCLITVPLLSKPNRESAMRTRKLVNAIAFLIIAGFIVILFT